MTQDSLTDEELARLERSDWSISDVPRLIAALRAALSEVERLRAELQNCNHQLEFVRNDMRLVTDLINRDRNRDR